MCGPYLNPDSNKTTAKSHPLGNQQTLIIVSLLDDIKELLLILLGVLMAW